MKKTLLWIAVGVSSLMMLAIILLLTLDLGRFKNSITTFASDYLGRELRIDDDLSIRLGRSLVVEAAEVRLGSTDWTEEPDLLKVGAVHLAIDTRSLLTDRIIIESLRVEGIRLNLSEDETGRNNYSLPGLESSSDSPSPSPSPSPDIFLVRVDVVDTLIHYRSPAFTPALTFSADALSLEQTAEHHLGLVLDASLNGTPVNATGSIGTMTDLMAATNVTFNLAASIGEITLRGEGRIDDLARPRIPAVALAVHGPSAEYLTDILELDPVTSGPLDLNITLTPSTDGLSAKIDGVYGEFGVNLNSQLSDLQNMSSASVVAHAAGPSLATLGRLAQQPGFPEEPYTLDIEAEKSGDLVNLKQLTFRTGDAQLNASARLPAFPGLADGIADVQIEGPAFEQFNWLPGLPGRFTGPFSLSGTLKQADNIGLLNAKLNSDALQVELTARITEEDDLTGTQASITLSDDDVTLIAEAAEIHGLPASPFAVLINAEFERQGIELTKSSLTLGSDLLEFSGMVGREPLSDLTHITAHSTLKDLRATLSPYVEDLPELSFNTLNVDISFSHSQERSLVNSIVTLPDNVRVVLDADIADSMEPESARLRLLAEGADLSTLLPPPLAAELGGPFSVTAGFRLEAEQILLEDGQAEFRGVRADVAARTPRSAPLGSGSAEFQLRTQGIFGLLPEAREYLQTDQALQFSAAGSWTPAHLAIEHSKLELGQAGLLVSGVIALPPESGAHEVQFETELDSLRQLQYLTASPLPDEPFRLQGTVTAKSSEADVSFSEITLGSTSITGRATLIPADQAQPRPHLNVFVRSPLTDLRPFASMLAGDEPEQPPPTPDDGRVIPDLVLPAGQLLLADMQVDILLDRLLTPELDVTNVVLLAVIDEGALDIERFELTGIMGTFNGALEAIPSERGLDLKLSAMGNDLRIGLHAATDAEFERLPRYEMDVRINSSGRTIREHAASTTGYVKGISGAGEIDLAAVGLFTRDFAGEVLNTVNPFAKKEPYSEVQCAALLVEMEDGTLFGDPALMFQTDKLNISAAARVDLDTEKLNATFSTRARRGLGISVSDIFSPYTELGGTLAAPRLQLNSKSAIFSGSTTIATAGLSILAKKAHERLLADQNPCRTEIQKVEEILKIREIAVPPS